VGLAKEKTHADDLCVLRVGLAHNSLRARVVEEAEMNEGGHPGANAMGTSMSVGTHEHVKAWCATKPEREVRLAHEGSQGVRRNAPRS
jgi:hypothetical protein